VETSLWAVALIAVGTALATGLGALPFAFTSGVGASWLGRGDALAAGLMLGATVGLMRAGIEADATLSAAGLVLGVVLVAIGSRIATGSDEPPTAEALARRSGIILVSVMTLHSCAEGVGVGVAFAGGDRVGVTTAIAIAVHNIPEGLAISLVLVPAGASVARAAAMSIFSSLPQPLLAVPAFLLVSRFEPLLPWGFGLAAGAMLWMVFGRLLVDAAREVHPIHVGAFTGLGLGSMLLLQAVLG